MYTVTELIYRRKGREAIALMLSETVIVGGAVRADGYQIERTEQYDTEEEAEQAFFGHQMHAVQLGFTLVHEAVQELYDDEEL